MRMRIAIPVVGLLLVAVAALVAMRDESGDVLVAVNVGETPVAIHGYDPVAYFILGEPTPGLADVTHEHEGAVFRFANTNHRDLFAADAARYMPAYGGYCAFGVTQKQKFDIDPSAWEIVDGRLFLQLDPGTRSVWMENLDENIRQADQIWPDIREIPGEDL